MDLIFNFLSFFGEKLKYFSFSEIKKKNPGILKFGSVTFSLGTVGRYPAFLGIRL